jgi:hypothetical protein
MAVSEQDEEVVYAATAPIKSRPHVYVTSSGGDSWTDITGNLPDRYPMDIAIDPDDFNTAYIVFAGYGTGHVFKTTNEGNDWTDITGDLPDVPTLAAVVDPFNSNHVYIGSDLGVFVSMDKGESWQELDNGLPEAIISMDLSISRANKSLRLASHGNGAWQMKLLSSDISSVNEDEKSTLPQQIVLEQNYPNPFNPTTKIKYTITNVETGHASSLTNVKLVVYDILGEEVTTLVNAEQIPGAYEVNWNASGFSSGVYYYILSTDTFSETNKMILLR